MLASRIEAVRDIRFGLCAEQAYLAPIVLCGMKIRRILREGCLPEVLIAVHDFTGTGFHNLLLLFFFLLPAVLSAPGEKKQRNKDNCS